MKTVDAERRASEIYARLTKAFSAADLDGYAKLVKGVPMEPVIQDLERGQSQRHCRRHSS